MKIRHAKLTAVLLFICSVFLLSACSNVSESTGLNPIAPETDASESTELAPIAPESELTIVPTQTKVAEFLEIIAPAQAEAAEFIEKNEGFIGTYYENDTCYNITPDFIAENSDFAVFKYDTSTESFLMYDGEIYSIGTCFGGYGITSMALADLNGDGQYELYYTFSWGSGMHRSQIGYFDPASKEITVLDYEFFDFDYDLMLTVDPSGELCVNSAELQLNSFVDYTIRAHERIGSIVTDENALTSFLADADEA